MSGMRCNGTKLGNSSLKFKLESVEKQNSLLDSGCLFWYRLVFRSTDLSTEIVCFKALHLNNVISCNPGSLLSPYNMPRSSEEMSRVRNIKSQFADRQTRAERSKMTCLWSRQRLLAVPALARPPPSMFVSASLAYFSSPESSTFMYLPFTILSIHHIPCFSEVVCSHTISQDHLIQVNIKQLI